MRWPIPSAQLVGHATEPGGLAHAQGHPGVELLPDPRHREEQGGRDLADVLGHRVEALGEVHRRAGVERVEDGEGPLRDVAEGQEGELLVALVQPGDEVGVAELEQDVAVAQHRPLGGAGGAGGVDQDREVVGPRDLDQAIEGVGVLPVVPLAQLEQRLEGHDLVVAERVQALHVVDEDLDQLRAAVAHRQDLVELLLVLREEEAGPAVVDDVLHLARGVGGVDAVGDGGHRHHAEVGVEPLRAVVRDDRDHVARPEPERDQPQADPPRAQAVLAPRDAAPDAEVLLPHRHPVAPLPHHVTEEPGQGVLAVHGGGDRLGGGGAAGLGLQRHVFFLFQRRVPRTLDSLRPR